MTLDYLSASGAKVFADCPKQFFLNYVERIEVPQPEDNKYILRGNSVHGAIEELLKNEPIDDQEQIHEWLTDNHSTDYPDSMKSDVEDCLEAASKYIANYVDDVRDVEERWEMDYNGINLVGYSDLINGDTIVDWKTGKSEGKEFDEKIQAAFYIKLFENEYGELPERVEFVYLNEGEISTHNRITQDGNVIWNNHQNKYWKDVQSIISRIQQAYNEDEWEADPGNCYWCDFKYVCKDSGIGAENVTRSQIEMGL